MPVKRRGLLAGAMGGGLAALLKKAPEPKPETQAPEVVPTPNLTEYDREQIIKSVLWEAEQRWVLKARPMPETRIYPRLMATVSYYPLGIGASFGAYPSVWSASIYYEPFPFIIKEVENG